MRLLLDENISWRCVKTISTLFEEVKHVKEISKTRMTDTDIWNYAEKHNFTILTNDADFSNLSILKGFPPKIIWLRFGNLPKDLFTNKILSKIDLINEFEKSDVSGVLELY